MDFVDGLRTVAGAGDPRARSGMAIHVYTCNASMEDKCKLSPQKGVRDDCFGLVHSMSCC